MAMLGELRPEGIQNDHALQCGVLAPDECGSNNGMHAAQVPPQPIDPSQAEVGVGKVPESSAKGQGGTLRCSSQGVLGKRPYQDMSTAGSPHISFAVMRL
jgi:hypothetical protein